MNYEEFLNVIIDDSIETERSGRTNPDKVGDATIAWLERCRGKPPEELFKLLDLVRVESPYASVKIAQICNCVGAFQHVNKERPIVKPTMYGYLKMTEAIRRIRDLNEARSSRHSST